MRHLIYHPESESLYCEFDEVKVDLALDVGCEIVTDIERFENRYLKEKAMQKNSRPTTVSFTITRDTLINNPKNPQSNEAIAGTTLLKMMRERGIPAVGVLGFITVEWGKLTIAHEDGLDGDEWTYEWTGVPLNREWAQKIATPGFAIRLDKPLAAMIAADEEL